MNFWDFLDIFEIFLLISVQQLVKKFVYVPYLLLIIRLRFTWGERKIWPNVEKSQNIMTMVVAICKNIKKFNRVNRKQLNILKIFQSISLTTHRTAEERRGPFSIPLYHFHPLTNIQTFMCNFAREMTITYF